MLLLYTAMGGINEVEVFMEFENNGEGDLQMRKKKIVTLALAATMMFCNSVPAFAIDLKQFYGLNSTKIKKGHDSSIGDYYYASGKKQSIPGWAWIDGYCYYFTNKNMRDKITNGTTPDGYTVDEQGRWMVNGVVQYNGYGSLQVGTDALYAGKGDLERWNAIYDYLINLYAKQQTPDDTVAFLSLRGGLSDDISQYWPFSTNHIIYNRDKSPITNVEGNIYYPEYIIAYFGNGWNDSPEYYSDYGDECLELTVKAICGDHAGQELFNDLRKAAEPAEGGARNQVVYDENGKPIKDEEKSKGGFTYVKMENYPTSGDGINFKYIDMAKWGSGQMKTDYGKSIYLQTGTNVYDDKDSHTPTEWILEIK